MPQLDNSTQHELLALLSPLLEREGDRQPLLAFALGTHCPALAQIEWSGAVEPFILRMVGALTRYGEIEPGKQALWKLLEAVRGLVGVDVQARIDALESIVNRPFEPPTAGAEPGVTKATAAPMHLRIFLASPGDVTQERGLALKVLEQLPYDPLLRGRVTIEAVAWDQPGAGTPMLATMTPQAAIAAGLPKPSQCDIVVVILWSRMGTPLPAEYASRTAAPISPARVGVPGRARRGQALWPPRHCRLSPHREMPAGSGRRAVRQPAAPAPQRRGLLRRLSQPGRLDPQRIQRVPGAGGLRPPVFRRQRRAHARPQDHM